MVKFENAAITEVVKLKSPKFYAPEPAIEDYAAGIDIMFDIMIIELETTINGIEPIWLPWSVKDFYFIEDKELVFVTLRNGDKQRLLGHRHEKCTKVHIQTASRCLMLDANNVALSRDQKEFFEALSIFPEMEPLHFSTFCTKDYQTIKVSLKL